MRLAATVGSGLHAALLFARGRSDALQFIEADPDGARRSFWALPIGLPAIVCLRLMNWVELGLPTRAGHAIGLDLMSYTVGWLGFAVVTYHVVPLFGRGARWPRFIAAWNWCNVVENLLLVAGGIPGLLGVPPIIDQAAQIIAVGWALWIEWFAIKESLDTTALPAVLLVVLDLMIGLLMGAVSVSSLQG